MSVTPEEAAMTAAKKAEERARALELQLSRIRSRPFSVIGDYALYRFLTLLSRASFLPKRALRVISKNAAQRYPKRSLAGWSFAEREAVETEIDYRGTAVKGGRVFDPARPTVLVVTHATSRTGAPILTLNIAEQLSARYNVVVLAGKITDLAESFSAASVALYGLKRYTSGRIVKSRLMDAMLATYDFRFAVVNSLESRGMLPPLVRKGVPVVSLIHEFATYTRSKSAIAEVLEASAETVFSTGLTRDDGLATLENPPDMTHVHVFPQGKCAIPGNPVPQAQREAEQARVRELLRPGSETVARTDMAPAGRGGAGGDFLVLGAGTVEYRKGLDLFIETAARVCARPEGAAARFVWFGHGYDPETDMGLSAYLKDQISRAGLLGRVSIERPTAEIETAYALADMLLLSSRLDPLPNVAIDALFHRLPIVCFDAASGVADILRDNGLGGPCVAPYLDTSAAATMILALAASPERRAQVAEAGQALAGRVFDLPAYVARIEALALDAAARAAQRDPATRGA